MTFHAIKSEVWGHGLPKPSDLRGAQGPVSGWETWAGVRASWRGPEARNGLRILPLLLTILPESPNGFQALKLRRAIKPVCFLESLINGRKSRP